MNREEIIKRLESIKTKVDSIQQPSALELDLLKDAVKGLYQEISDWKQEPVNEAKAQTDLHIVQEPEESSQSESNEVPVAEEPIAVKEPQFPRFVEKHQEPENKEATIAEHAEAVHPDNSLAAKLNKNGIESLKSAIGLNDKFALVNGLFKGDISAYNQAIEKLDSSTDLNSAQEFVNFLQNNYGWEQESGDLASLHEFVQRRFS